MTDRTGGRALGWLGAAALLLFGLWDPASVRAAGDGCPPHADAVVQRLLLSGQSAAAKGLVDQGCVPAGSRTWEGIGLLALAARLGDLAVVDALVQQGHAVDDADAPPLAQAFFGHVLDRQIRAEKPWRGRQVEVIVYLINSGAPVDIDLDGPDSRNFIPSLWNVVCRKPSWTRELALVEPDWVRVRRPYRLEPGTLPALQEKHAATHDATCTTWFVNKFAMVL